MSGTSDGGHKAAQANTSNDPDFYKKIGAIGGAKSRNPWITGKPELAREIGKLGGRPIGHLKTQAEKDKQSESMKATWRLKRELAAREAQQRPEDWMRYGLEL